MKEKSFFSLLNKDEKFVLSNSFYLYFVIGIYSILIGSVLPMITHDYSLSYLQSGRLISAHSAGNIIAGLVAGYLPLYIGMKNSILALNSVAYLGFALTLFTGNPIMLIVAFFMTGVGRGAISNYNNVITSKLSGGDAGALNMLHAFFAIGALIAPFLTLALTKNNISGWRKTIILVIVLGAVSLVTSGKMNMDSSQYVSVQKESKNSFAFLKEKLFWLTAIIMLMYLAVEATVMGWITTYFIDSGTIGAESAQVLNSVMWITILIGRFITIYLLKRVSIPKMIALMSSVMLVFYVLLVASSTLLPLVIATIGLGLGMAGMYATTLANAGSILSDFPLSMGFFTTISGLGSIVMPSIVGGVAGVMGIRKALSIIIAVIVLQVVFAFINLAKGESLLADWGKRKQDIM